MGCGSSSEMKSAECVVLREFATLKRDPDTGNVIEPVRALQRRSQSGTLLGAELSPHGLDAKDNKNELVGVNFVAKSSRRDSRDEQNARSNQTSLEQPKLMQVLPNQPERTAWDRESPAGTDRMIVTSNQRNIGSLTSRGTRGESVACRGNRRETPAGADRMSVVSNQSSISSLTVTSRGSHRECVASGGDRRISAAGADTMSEASSRASQSTTASMRLADEKRDKEVIKAKLRAHYLQQKQSVPAVLENADYKQLNKHWQRLHAADKIIEHV